MEEMIRYGNELMCKCSNGDPQHNPFYNNKEHLLSASPIDLSAVQKKRVKTIGTNYSNNKT